jgi:hypothetical protein
MPDLEKRSGAEVSKGGPVRPALTLPTEDASPFPPDRLVRELLDRWWSLHVGSRGSSHSVGGLSGSDLRNSVNLALLTANRAARKCHPGPWSGKAQTKPTPHQVACDICNGRRNLDGDNVGRPVHWTTVCPIEEFYRLRDKANRAVAHAASYQFRHVPVGWNPKQHPQKDSPTQARARKLWARADTLCVECDAAENAPTFDLLIRFLGIVLATCSVHEDAESFSRYAIP